MFNKRFAAMAVLFAFTAAGWRQTEAKQPTVPSNQGAGQNNSDAGPLHFKVNDAAERLEMIVRSSRILTMDQKVPRMLANNPDVIRVTPLSPNQIQVSALKPGVTQLNLWDEKENVISVDVVVYGDARELDNMLKVTFPEASIQVIPLATSVMLSGFVPEVESVSRIVRTAEDYYPRVINNLTVGGTQKVLLHVKVMEVSRTKLRRFGFDWAQLNSSGTYVTQSATGLLAGFTTVPPIAATGSGGSTVNFGIVNSSSAFFGFIEALRHNTLVKIMAEPTLVTVSGRPATFNVGGEFPIMVPQSLGTVSVQFRQFGTRVDFVPIVLGKGNIRLEVRPQVTEIDRSSAATIGSTTIPGLRTRMVDTAVEMKCGQTLALAGLLQQRIESENRGVPVLADLPWAGAAFRRVQESVNEVELLITVTPEFADALDAHEVPPCMPGQLTTSPNNVDLYMRGYLEVPKCCDDGTCGPSGVSQNGGYRPGVEYVPAPSHPTPADAVQFRRNPSLPIVSSYPSGVPAPASQPGSRSAQTPANGYRVTASPASSSGQAPYPNPVGVATPAPRPVVTQYPNPQFPQPVYQQGQPTPAFQPKPTPIGPLGYDELR